MIKISLTKKDFKRGIEIAAKRNRGDYKNFYKDFIGVIGELAYSIHTGLPMNENIYNFGDHGIDFPDGAQVKASDLDVLPNLQILEEKWGDQTAKFFVLMWFCYPNTVYIVGKISREKANGLTEIVEYNGERLVRISNQYLEEYKKEDYNASKLGTT